MRFQSRFDIWFLAIAGIPALLRGQSSPPPSLGAAASFAVLGGSTVTSSGSTIITGNLGVSPGNTITGSPTVKVGATFRNDSTARQAQKDATAAYNDLAGRTCNSDLSGQDLGGKTLAPGVYCFSSSAQLTGTLILDAANDPNAVWVFQVRGTLTTAIDSSVRVIGGGHESNVYWQAGDAILGSHSVFVGSLLALTDITLNSAVAMSGRALARGVVALDSSNVSLCCDPIVISPTTLPCGTVGASYNVQFAASGGIGPYTVALLSGQLPPKLGPIKDNALSGTPTTEGSYTFTVVATDAHGCTGVRTYTVKISCPAIIVSPSALPPTPSIPYPLPMATACSQYTATFSVMGDTASYTFSLTATGRPFGPGTFALPSGVLKWTPKKSGKYTFIVTATDKYGCSGSQVYEVVVACEAISISPPTLPYGQVCARYNQPIVAAGCDPPYVLSLESGKLPPGLTGPTPGNAIIGIPAKPGPYRFTIKATDADDTACFTTRDYRIVITCPVITISPSVLPPATCQRYCVQLTPSCAIGSTKFSVTAGSLPPGLSLSPDGMLCGKPSLAGSYDFTVTFTDSVSGCTGSAMYTLLVTGVTITPASLPAVPPGTPYNEVITASGGVAPYTFVLSGMLPPGLTFTPGTPTATISGIPTMVGCFPFTVTVTDAKGCSTTINYTICIATGGLTLSGWGMIVLSILLVGAGWVMMRKGGLA
jgi:hypothetical protein